MLDNPLSFENFLALNGEDSQPLEFFSLFLTALCIVLLLFIHWITPRFRKLDLFNNAILNSMIGGFSFGYVLLNILPKLMLNLEELREETHSNFLGNERNFTFIIFMFFLIGFLVPYILEKLTSVRTEIDKKSNCIYYIANVGILTFLHFIIALMIPAIANESLLGLFVFTFIMGSYFILQDYSMSHHFSDFFDELGRYIIMIGIVSGWLVGVFLLSHTHNITETLMSAFLAGALILGVLKIEFSTTKGYSHFPTFVASLSVQAAGSLIILLLQSIH